MSKYIISSTNNKINFHFKKLLKEINEKGLESAPRGKKVKELYFKEMNIDTHYPIIDFKSRPFPFSYLAGELCWYMLKDTNVNYISKFSSFWNILTNEDNTVNSNYGNLIFGDQLSWVKKSLKKDKNTRQAIAFLNRPVFQYDGNKDFVCTMYLNFFIRENKLNMKMTIRSQDAIRGTYYDAPFFSFVLQHMYLWLKEEAYPDLELGSYYHFMDNVHFYEEHYELVENILKESKSSNNYSMILKKPMFHINENSEESYILPENTKDFIEEILNLRMSGEKQLSVYKEKLQKYFIIE